MKPIKFIKTGNVPVSANFINTQSVTVKPLIPMEKKPEQFKEKDRADVEKWLVFCAIATTMLETGTRALKNKGLIHDRNAIFDLVNSFKQLNKAFTGNPEFDSLQNEVDTFLFTFLNLSSEDQNRVVKFQESLINKNYKHEQKRKK